MALKTFVTNSTLSQEDKDLWFSILENLDETQIKIFENFVDPERGREDTSRTKQDAEHVRGFVRDTQRASASYGVNDKEENLKELTNNLKAKRMAIEELDEKALDKVVTREQWIASSEYLWKKS